MTQNKQFVDERRVPETGQLETVKQICAIKYLRLPFLDTFVIDVVVVVIGNVQWRANVRVDVPTLNNQQSTDEEQ